MKGTTHVKPLTAEDPETHSLGLLAQNVAQLRALFLKAFAEGKICFGFLDLLEDHGVALVSCKEQFDTTTPMGCAFLGILMIVASLESDIAHPHTPAQKNSAGEWLLSHAAVHSIFGFVAQCPQGNFKALMATGQLMDFLDLSVLLESSA